MTPGTAVSTGGTVIATVPVGTRRIGAAINPDGTHAYVADANDNTVSVITIT